MTEALLDWATAIALALMLAGMGLLMDPPEPLSAIQAQHEAQQQARAALAAQKMCSDTVGEAAPVWLDDNRVLCKPRRGKGAGVVLARK